MINLSIEEYYISEKYKIKEYDKLLIEPYINLTDVVFLNNKFSMINKTNKIFDDAEREDFSQKAVRYLYFEVDNLVHGKKVIISIHNNFKKCKLWVNGIYQSYFEGWYGRTIYEIKNKKIQLLFEIYEMDFAQPFLISLREYDCLLISNPFEIEDEKRDIRKLYIVSNSNNIDDDGHVRFSVRTDYGNLNLPIKCVVMKQYYINELEKNLKILDEFDVHINELIKYNVEKLFDNDNSLDTVLFKIISGDDIEESSLGIRFSKDNFENKTQELEKALYNLNNKLADWQKIFYDCEMNYIQNTNFNNNTKFYLYDNLINTILDMNKYENQIDYLLAKGLKTICFNSKIDNRLFKFFVYNPLNNNNNKIPLILVLSSFSSKAYINDYSKMFENGYIIVECSTRGKHFGNYIAESTVLEVIAYINDIYNIDQEKIYIIGYSSSGSVAFSLIEKYPNKFCGGLFVSCLSNLDLISNIENNIIINLCGEYDKNLDINFLEKNNRINSNNFFNIIVKNLNDYTATIFMRNSQLISQLLNYDKKNINIKTYKISSLLFNNYNDITVVKKMNHKKDCKIKIIYQDNYIDIYIENIDILKIEKQNFNLYQGNNELLLKGNENNNYLYSVTKRKLINNIGLLESFNKLELLNLFFGGLTVVYDNSSIEDAYKYTSPTANVIRSVINVSYPIIKSSELDINHLQNRNYLFYNCNVNDYILKNNLSNGNIICKEDGFYYKGQFYEGKYSIIQSTINICYNDKICAFINYNDKNSYHHNIFLRKFVIPSDYSQNKSIYRNYAIIMLNRKYYIIRNYESDIELLNFTSETNNS